MTTRNATAVIVRLVTTKDGEQKTTFFGPFLPHVGSATTRFISTLEEELREGGRFDDWDTYVEDVFIGVDESDAAVLSRDRLPQS